MNNFEIICLILYHHFFNDFGVILNYCKWKSTFERYMKDFDDEVKYDYLFSHTEGIGHGNVANKSSYREAITNIDEKFGNRHIILKLLLDEIRALPLVKRGDVIAFEKLSFKMNNLRERLVRNGTYHSS